MKKKETLEEVAEQYAEIYRCPATNNNEYCRHDIISAINFGAKWQQEQDKKMYSKEELINISIQYFNHYYNISSRGILIIDHDLEWFEQFKNKTL
jgi:hypothetical protein